MRGVNCPRMRSFLATILFLAATLQAAGAGATDRPEGGNFSLSYETSPGEAWRARVERARLRYEAFAARAYQDYLAHSSAADRRALAPQGAEQTLRSILGDPTLRKNDIYVSEDGVLVFRGAPGSFHQAADFAPMPARRAEALSLKIDVRMK